MRSDPIRLGLPWRLPHYVPLNGPHPLVDSYLRGNAAVQAVPTDAARAATPAQQQAVLERMAHQMAAVPEAQAMKFAEWLQLGDQCTLEAQAADSDALFLHTTPLYAGSARWVFHFESFPSLFMPFMFTGTTTGLDLTAQPFFRLVRSTLASPRCVRIFSHMREGLRIAERCFADAAITAKLHHVPLGIEPVDPARWAGKFAPGQPLRILFTNSLHHHPDSFYLRGGHHLLEAFGRVRRERPDAQLTVLSSVPSDLLQRFTPQDLIGVQWINTRVDDSTLEALFLAHQVFALPAAGLHSHSLLRALASGCVPLLSDAPGYDEYTGGIEDSILSVRGVRALVYRDEPAGWVSDRYAPFIDRCEALVQQIHGALRDHGDAASLHGWARRNAAHCRERFAPADSHAAFNRMLGAL